MIRFIYGESGYGKTHRIVDMIKTDVENNKKVFLIVPDQEAVAAERRMLSLLPPSAQLCIEVLGFSRLYNRVCREYGGLEYNYLTKPAKQLIMWSTVREICDSFKYYHEISKRDTALPSKMLAALDEFKANGITAEALENASNSFDEDSELACKLYDLALIYAAYKAQIENKFGDAADDVSKLYELLREHSFFAGTNVYIDSFTSYTFAEHRVIERMFADADNVTITIPLAAKGARSIYTESISAAEKILIKNANSRGGYTVETLTENKRASAPALAYLAKNIWSFGKVEGYTERDARTSIRLESCETPYAEAEAAARWVRALAKGGYRYSDIVVVCADVERYRGIIEPAFERNDIAYYISKKSDLCSKSILKFIISAFRIKKLGWRTGDVVSHIKTGIYDLTEDDCDLFENYVSTWRIRGADAYGNVWTMNPGGYSNDEINERGARILASANRVRELLYNTLLPLFAKLDAASTPLEMCRALYEFLVQAKAKERLDFIGKKQQERKNAKEAQEYASLYNITLNAIATVAEHLPQKKITADEFAEALKTVFDATDIGTIPTSVDEVLIGSASMIRTDNPKCVIVLGLCEGEFPRKISDTGVLNFSERELLSDIDLVFTATEKTKQSDELMFIQKAFSLPRDLLILTTAKSSADLAGKRPSLPYNRVKALFPRIKEHEFDERDVTYLTGGAKDAARFAYSQLNTENGATLRASLEEYSKEYSYLGSPKPPAISTPEAKISDKTAAELFKQDMSMSPTKLEKYVKCHFAYYCTYVLGLRDESVAEFNALNRGNFVHYLLENMIKALVNEDGVFDPPSDDELLELAKRIASDYLSLLLPQKERDSGIILHLCERLTKLTLLLVKNIIEEFKHSEFTPEFFELKIGKGEGEIPPLEFVLEDGSRVSLKGTIDRVDLYRKDGTVFVRVVDYKTGEKSFSIDDLALGLNTQMLMYLFALCASDRHSRILRSDTPPIPAGVMYLSLSIATLKLEDYDNEEAMLKKAAASFDRCGLLLNDADVLKAMNDEYSPKFLAGISTVKEKAKGKKKKAAEPEEPKQPEFKGEALTSLERFDEIRLELERTISDIARNMRCGVADANPLIHKGESPCEYCEMNPVCRVITKNKSSDESSDREE